MDIWIWWNKMVKIWDKMFNTEDEEASESEESDDNVLMLVSIVKVTLPWIKF